MDYVNFLSKTFLFNGVESNEIKNILVKHPYTIEDYNRTQFISGTPTDGRVGFIVYGGLDVIRSRGDGSATLLNRLSPGDSFGILSVFSNEQNSTQIYVSKNSKVLFFSKEQVLSIVNNNLRISMNTINFLADRVSFLNRKIETFSGVRVENRLASFIIQECKKQNNSTITFNLKKCSETINAGRASVYRAISSLESNGLILFNKKTIIITDLEGLERSIK